MGTRYAYANYILYIKPVIDTYGMVWYGMGDEGEFRLGILQFI